MDRRRDQRRARRATLSVGWLYDRFDWVTLSFAVLPFLFAALVAAIGIGQRMRRSVPAV